MATKPLTALRLRDGVNPRWSSKAEARGDSQALRGVVDAALRPGAGGEQQPDAEGLEEEVRITSRPPSMLTPPSEAGTAALTR